MNKSKFLKKSLAMVLAVMLVIAMIPLGASAASTDGLTTDLKTIKIDGNTVNVEADGKTFKADVATGSNPKVWVTGLYTGETATLTDKNDDSFTVSGVAEPAGLDLENDYNANGTVYTIPLTLTSSDGEKTAEYVVQLNVVSKKTTTTISKVAATKALNASVSGRTITVNVPLGYANAHDGDLYMYTADNATIDGISPEATGDYVGSYKKAGFVNGDTVTVISQSGGNSITYKIVVNETPILTAFKAGDKAAKIDNEKMTITATYPASVLVKPGTEFTAPVQSMETTFTVAAGAELTYTSGKYTTPVTLTSGKSYDYTDGTLAFDNDPTTGATLEVVCKDISAIYHVIFTTEEATDNTITAATVDGETATVGASTITANLQSGAKDTDNVDVVLTTSELATVIVNGGAEITPTKIGDGKGTSTASVAVGDLKKGVVVVVKAQNGTQKQYNLKVTVTGEVSEAKLTSFALKKGANVYQGTISGSKITVTVPYMTTNDDLDAMDVVATTNPYVMATADDGLTAAKKGADLGFANPIALSGNTGTTTGTVKAVAKKNTGVQTTYTVEVKLAAAQTGGTLTNMTLTSAKNYKTSTKDNSYAGVIKKEANNTNSLTFKAAYSQWKNGADLYLKSITLPAGAVAYTATATGAAGAFEYTLTAMPAVLDSTNTATDGTAFTPAELKGSSKDADFYVVVLPEKKARALAVAGATKIDDAGIKAAKGTAYVAKVTGQDPKEGTSLTGLKLGDNCTLPASLSGTIPYGYTVAEGFTPDEDHTYFAEFDKTIATFATLHESTGKAVTFVSGGADADGNGEVDAASATNAKFFFERQPDGTVKVSYYTGGGSATPLTGLTVVAEDGVSTQTYPKGTLKFAAANTDAKFTKFVLAGANGVIKDDVITVNVPHGTKINALVPTFETTAGATVTDDVTPKANVVKSGETIIDFSNDVTLKVTSEDGKKTVSYTIKVTADAEFIDVPKDQWYYEPVMAAAAAGIVKGRGNGRFAPEEFITRRDFAIMVTNMLGADLSTYTTSGFPDVADNDYAMTAIAYCKDHDIFTGDGKGNFNPAKNITRQEAAIVIANALGLSGTPAEAFKDDAKIADWAKTQVNACKAAEIFEGDPHGNFNPTINIRRCEAAKVMVEAMGK